MAMFFLSMNCTSSGHIVQRHNVLVKSAHLFCYKLSLHSHRAKHTPQDLLDMLIDYLDLWQELIADDAPHIEDHDQGLWFLTLIVFLRPQRYCILSLPGPALDLPKNLCLIISDDSKKQVCFCLKMFDDVLTQLQEELLLIIIQLASFFRRLSIYPKHWK